MQYRSKEAQQSTCNRPHQHCEYHSPPDRSLNRLSPGLTFGFPPKQAIVILICVYVGAIYGGSRSAIHTSAFFSTAAVRLLCSRRASWNAGEPPLVFSAMSTSVAESASRRRACLREALGRRVATEGTRIPSSDAAASGLWTIADDTGLEVDALGGAPGVRTARLSEDDASRRAKLLQLLAAHPRPWTARFRCSVALAGPRGEVAIGRGDCEGEILPKERGDHGFGYDPIFLVAGTHYTMAELPLIEKNRLSHRARAVRALLPELRARLTSPN